MQTISSTAKQSEIILSMTRLIKKIIIKQERKCTKSKKISRDSEASGSRITQTTIQRTPIFSIRNP